MKEVYEKSVAPIESTDDDKFGPNGGFTAVLTNDSLDRDGDRLFSNEWMPLAERYPLDFDHEMSVAGTIGSYHPYFDGDRILMDAYFSSIPKAQEVRTLVNEGHIRSVSVAFMTDKTKKDGEPKREMLNAGIVAIPSNRDAVIMASKAASVIKETVEQGLMTTDEVKVALGITPEAGTAETKAPQGQSAGSGDRAMLQAIHDASVHMGAVCVVPLQGDEDNTGADDGANKSVSFANATGQVVQFDSHDEARAFFNDMLKSIEDAEANEETLVAVGQEPADLEAFEQALDEVLTPEDSPAESPADEAAAASDEEPAPADEAADDAADDDLASRARALEFQLSLLT